MGQAKRVANDMARTVFHIGFPKTATKLLQARLFHQHPELAAVTILDVRQDGNARAKHAFNLLMRSDENTFEAHRDDVAAALDVGDGRQTRLISQEDVAVGHANRPARFVDRRRILERIARVLPDTDILVSTRAQIELLESLYLQYTASPSFRESFEDFLETEWHNRAYGSLVGCLMGEGLLTDLRATLPRARITVLPYELLSREPERYAAILAGACGISTDSVRSRIENVHVHTRVSRPRYAARRLKTLVPFGQQLNRVIPSRLKTRVLDRGARQTIATPPGWRRTLAGEFASGNRLLSDTFDLALHDLGYPT
jgi:hypothetical protein